MKLSFSKNSCKLYLLVTVCLWHINSSAAEGRDRVYLPYYIMNEDQVLDVRNAIYDILGGTVTLDKTRQIFFKISKTVSSVDEIRRQVHPDGMTHDEMKELITNPKNDFSKYGNLGGYLLRVRIIQRATKRNTDFEALLRDPAAGPEALEAYKDLVRDRVLLSSGKSPLHVITEEVAPVRQYCAKGDYGFTFKEKKKELANGDHKIKWLLTNGAHTEEYQLQSLGPTCLLDWVSEEPQTSRILLDYGAEVSAGAVKEAAYDPWTTPEKKTVIAEAEVNRRRWQGEGGLRAAWLRSTVGVAIDAAEPARPVPVMPGAGAGAVIGDLK